MDIQIRKYQSYDHIEVRRIFVEGQMTQMLTGMKSILKNPKLILVFLLGFIQSLNFGLFLIMGCIGIQCFQIASIFGMYTKYIKVLLIFFYFIFNCEQIFFSFSTSRQHLDTDMKDPDLKFWTTPPNIFLVAKTNSGQVLGTISYRYNNKTNMPLKNRHNLH